MSDFGLLFSTVLNGLIDGSQSEPIGRDDIKGLIVSTVVTSDMGPETAICDKDSVYPVQRYASVAAAKRGHAVWCSRVKKGLRKVKKLGYGDLVGGGVVTLKPKKASK